MDINLLSFLNPKAPTTMAIQRTAFFLLTFGLCSLMATASSRSLPANSHVALFVFGDSLFDPGNNNYFNGSSGGHMSQATAWPYGETFFKRPTGRLSDGRIVPDFIAEFLRLPVWKPYLQPGAHEFTNGANFASGGAGVLTDNNAGTINLGLQLSYFKDVVSKLKKQIGESQTQKLLNSAVYLFSMGGNDYFHFYTSYPNASSSSMKQYVGIVTGNLTQVIEEIYNLGGRKIAFQNAGALGCVPINMAKSVDGKTCIEELSTMASMHNRQLSESLKGLERRLPGFKYSIFNYYNAILDRVFHPSKYGFENGTGSCYTGGSSLPGEKSAKVSVCKDPSKYVWFDGGHTTEACNWQLAKLMWKGKQDTVSPYNIKQLLAF